MPTPRLSVDDVSLLHTLVRNEVVEIKEVQSEHPRSIKSLDPYLMRLEAIERKLSEAIPGSINPSGQESPPDPTERL